MPTRSRHSGKVESLLSGETLARYRALPEEYRVALDAYSAFGVSDDLIPTVVAEKMAQWPDSPEPIRDLLDAERYAIFGELTATHPKLEDEPKIQILSKFFLAYYPYVVLNEDTVEGRKQAFANLLDASQPISTVREAYRRCPNPDSTMSSFRPRCPCLMNWGRDSGKPSRTAAATRWWMSKASRLS